MLRLINFRIFCLCSFATVLMISITGCGIINNAQMQEENKIQFGVASWYGNKFHGGMTKSGEKYDKNDYTAAHRSLPFGTVIKVTNVKNGRSVVVKINDRGPKKASRKLDLSYAAAEKIGMIQDGITNVKIDIIDQQVGMILLDEQKNQDIIPTKFDSYKEEYKIPYITSIGDYFKNNKLVNININKIPMQSNNLVE